MKRTLVILLLAFIAAMGLSSCVVREDRDHDRDHHDEVIIQDHDHDH